MSLILGRGGECYYRLAYSSGFTVTHIVVAFIYLSFAHIPERPDGDEAEILEPHTINAHYIAAMLFFVVFGDNMVRWIKGSETSHWFWLFSGKGSFGPPAGKPRFPLCNGSGFRKKRL